MLGRHQLLVVLAGGRGGGGGGGGGRRRPVAAVAVAQAVRRRRGLLLLLPGGGVVGRRRRERRLQGGRGEDGVVLGRARLRLPQEGHGARRGDAVVHPEGRRRGGALPGEQLREHLALPLLQLETLLLVLAGDGCH